MAESTKHKPLSLTPAFFTPFKGFSNDPPPTEGREHYETVLRNLEKQQAAVRRKMLFMIDQHRNKLVARAEEQLKELEDEGLNEGDQWDSILKVDQEEFEAMMKEMKTRARPGSKIEDYEIKKGQFDSVVLPPVSKGNAGDVEISGVGSDLPRRPSGAQIRFQLQADLRVLVESGVQKMEEYDVHAAATVRAFKDNWARKMQGLSIHGTTPRPGPSILKNRTEDLKGDTQILRTSTGMPIAFLPQTEPARNYENFENFARRDSR